MRLISEHGEKIVVLAIALMLSGQIVGQPVLLSFVQSGSMEPTLDRGDGFVALPPAVTGPPSEGDVIIYRANQLNGGGLTTHRVVDETSRGYITRGDANPFTDQSAGEPPVRQAQIVAVALQIGDDVVVIPHVGTGTAAVREVGNSVTSLLGVPFDQNSRPLWLGIAAAGLVFLLFGENTQRRQKRPSVSEQDTGVDSGWWNGSRKLVVLTGVVVISFATASMVLPLGPTEYRIVSAESDVSGPQVIPAGEAEKTTYRIPSGGILPTRYHIEPASEGVAIENGSGITQPGGKVNVSVTLSAPPETGSYRRYVAEHRYPVVVPVPVIDALYVLHPIVPVAVIDILISIPFVLLAHRMNASPRTRDSPGAESTGLLKLRS